MSAPALLWLRRELRLHDNAALLAAARDGRPIVPVYVLDDEAAGDWKPGGAHRWWLHHSLQALGEDFAQAGVRLVLRRGDTVAALRDLARRSGATEVHAGAPVEPWAKRLAAAVGEALDLRLHTTVTLFDLDAVRTKAGGAYGVYTPFMQACRAMGPPPPCPAPGKLHGPSDLPSDELGSWGLLPTRPDWAGGLRDAWGGHGPGGPGGPGGPPGEAGARARLHHFVQHGLADYARTRNLPGMDGTSMLSPRLHWGEISATEAWHAAAKSQGAGRDVWQNELLWREFSAHLLHHHPDLPEQPLHSAFAAMPWRHDPSGLRAWQRGQTGVPIVDAGMRQLWRMGWMHNRVRMIVASFLIKHLLVHWRDGERWFWDTLVDGDLGNNSGQWQWVAGSGADAAPFFRVFNPVVQGTKFDPDGAYVRAWVPEVAKLPDRYLHAPWEAPDVVREQAGLRLGRGYPAPIVDLAQGRARALAAFRAVRQGAR
jgi:deoxyribodipyrimidine photo-lyase